MKNKKHHTLTLIVTLSVASIGNAVQIGFFPLDSSIPGFGLFEYNTNVDVYFMSGGPGPVPPDEFSLLSSRVDLGTYQLNDNLTVAPFEFSLGALQPLLSNGVDGYLSLVLLGGSTIMTIDKLESEWFGTATDLIGLDIPNPTFEINELRSDLYGNVPFQTRQIDYLDLGITIVPEPATSGLLLGCLTLSVALLKKRRLKKH